jgi:multidrug efflux pump subunit AcrA (membrane-fusion protein)
MKMEHTIVSPIDGIVAELSVEVGQLVSTGDALAVVGAAAGADQDCHHPTRHRPRWRVTSK